MIVCSEPQGAGHKARPFDGRPLVFSELPGQEFCAKANNKENKNYGGLGMICFVA